MRDGQALTIAATLAEATRRLSAVSDTPRLDAELMMAHALGVSREDLLLSYLRALSPPSFPSLLARRLMHEPVAYIVGMRSFWTIDLAVGPGVLIPRPDSETLIEAAILHFGEGGPETILDLGTGPGTLLLAALDQWRDARGIGVDRSIRALDYAWGNAERLGLASRATFQIGDWAEGLEGPFDLILCNPPYVEQDADLPRDVVDHEPHEALFSGLDGLDDLRRLATQLPCLLSDDGIAMIEIGSGQGQAALKLFQGPDRMVRIYSDLGGRDRSISFRRINDKAS